MCPGKTAIARARVDPRLPPDIHACLQISPASHITWWWVVCSLCLELAGVLDEGRVGWMFRTGRLGVNRHVVVSVPGPAGMGIVQSASGVTGAGNGVSVWPGERAVCQSDGSQVCQYDQRTDGGVGRSW